MKVNIDSQGPARFYEHGDGGTCWFEAQLLSSLDKQFPTVGKCLIDMYENDGGIKEELRRPKTPLEMREIMSEHQLFIYGWEETGPNMYHFNEDLPLQTVENFFNTFLYGNGLYEELFYPYDETTILQNMSRKDMNPVMQAQVARIHRTTAKFGIKGVISSKLEKDIRDIIGDATHTRYLAIIDDHDNRVVNNYFATIKQRVIVTCTPPTIIGSNFENIETLTIRTTSASGTDSGIQFSLDIGTYLAFMMTDEVSFACSDDVWQTLSKQPNMTLPTVSSLRKTCYLTYEINNEVLNHDMSYLIGPIIDDTTEGELLYECGTYKIKHNLYYAGPSTSIMTQLNYQTGQLLAGHKEIKYKASKVYVMSRRTIGCMQILGITSISYKCYTMSPSNTCNFNIPIIHDWVLKGVVPKVSFEKHTLNKELLNRLMNKNLTLTVGDNAMYEYGMALSWYSYNKRNVELSSNKITPEQIRTHVYVAKVLLLRHTLSEMAINLILGDVSFKNLALIASSVMSVALNYIRLPDIIKNVLEVVTSQLKEPAIRTQTLTILEAWDSINVWCDSGDINMTVNDSQASCIHHSTCTAQITNEQCKCCFKLTATLNDLCPCCQPNSYICSHPCTHEHNGPNVCECCERQYDIKCECCELSIHKINFKDKPNFTNTQTQQKKISTQIKVINGKEIKTIKTTTPCKFIDDNYTHEHVCEICKEKYIHKHKSDNEPHIMHDQFVGDCPKCKGDVDHLNYVIKKSEQVKPLFMKQQVPEYSITALVEVLTPNTVEYLTSNATEPKIPLVYGLNSNFKSTLPFLIQKSLNPSEFDIYDVMDVSTDNTNTDVDCGYDVLVHYLSDVISKNQVEREIRRVTNLSTRDFHKIFRLYGMNLITVEATVVEVTRMEETDEFAVVIHSSSVEAKYANHWLVGKLKWKLNNDFQVMPYGSILSSPEEHEILSKKLFGETYNHCEKQEQLHVSYMLANKFLIDVKNENQPGQLSAREFSNKGSLMHNKYSEYTIPTDKIGGDYITAMYRSIQSRRTDEILTGVWDASVSNSGDIITHIKNSIRDICYNVALTFESPEKYCRIQVLPLIDTLSGNKAIDFFNTRVKDGDVVFIKRSSTYEPLYVSFAKQTNYMITNQMRDSKIHKVSVLIPKASYISMMHKLSALTKSTENKQIFDKCMKHPDTKCYIGYGGTGKTHKMSEIVKEMLKTNSNAQILAVALTTNAVQVLANKISNSRVNTTTYESAMRNTRDTQYSLIVIDEASMIKPYEIALITKHVTPLLIMGDPFQTGAEDFAMSGGRREIFSMITYCENINVSIERFTDTRRFGEQLANELKQHPSLTDINSIAEHSTNIKMLSYTKATTDIIVDAFKL